MDRLSGKRGTHDESLFLDALALPLVQAARSEFTVPDFQDYSNQNLSPTPGARLAHLPGLKLTIFEGLMYGRSIAFGVPQQGGNSI
jgi:hypothetical protein